MTPRPEGSATAAPERPAAAACAEGAAVPPAREPDRGAAPAAAPAAPTPAPTAAPTAAPPARTAEPAAQDAPKYEFETLLAEGAEGRVYVVQDHDLARRVAMKVMRPGTHNDARRLQRFRNEARRTAALEHAGIPAVHDLGYVATGEMFFTMRLVEGRTLREVFDRIASGDSESQREWTLVRIVQVLQQVAAAVDYAHCQGILHRDLKPENVAVSDYQEVLVLDWGLSKKLGNDPDAPHAQVEPNPFATQVGAVKGTPLYMAPEQARGAVDQLDVRADVFSLGAILYEALCHEPPYDGETVHEILQNARAGRVVPLDRRPRGKEVPRALLDTCMRALSPDRVSRHANAKVFAEDLQSFLEGTKEREIRAREASSLVESARRLAHRARALLEESVRQDRQAAELRRTVAPWAPEPEKSRVWQIEDGASRTRIEAADTHARAADLAARALALDATHAEARATLAQLYHDRFLDAERRGHAEEATWLRRMVERYDDGTLGERMRERAGVCVVTEPENASVSVVRVVERNRRRVEGERRDMGLAPVADDAIVPGDYVLRVAHPDCAPARVPIRLGRGSMGDLAVRLAPRAAVPAGFLWIAGGSFLCGHGVDTAEVDLRGFAMMERPVLLREYALWLDEVALGDPAVASGHTPWVESHGPLLHLVDGRHVFCPPERGARRPIADHADLPVVGVSRTSAEAYARWTGARLGADVRLPTELEWEKAARGTDGRTYPWGDHFDPTFCSMIASAQGESNLRAVGSFPADVSPYGMRDMAGGVREWCRDEPPDGVGMAVCRGGAWYLRARECTVTSRWIVEAATRNPGIGFRLVCEVPSV